MKRCRARRERTIAFNIPTWAGARLSTGVVIVVASAGLLLPPTLVPPVPASAPVYAKCGQMALTNSNPSDGVLGSEIAALAV